MIYILLALAAAGHLVLWSAAVNRLHGLGIERRWVDAATLGCALLLAALPLAIAFEFWRTGFEVAGAASTASWSYLAFCAVYCLASAAHRVWMTLHPERRDALESNHTTRVDMRLDRDRAFAPGIPALLGRVPGNQVLDLHIHEKRLAIRRLPAGNELRIAHISDLHMSGRIGKSFFEEMAAAVNELQPDLIAITGDLVERDACLDWVPDTLGRLHAEHGVYFVFGNHDLRVDHRRLLAALTDLGLVYLGGTWREVCIRDIPVVVAGNEIPWFGPAADAAELPGRSESGLPLRVLLAHGPDQFRWAREHDFDLMLAGHNHGGQVRLPVLGPILAPSLSGVRYAGGTYRRENTVLHVSRGTSSLTPFRWNCPPEIALLNLSRGTE